MAVFSVDSDEVAVATASIHGTIDRLQTESSTLLGQLTRLQASWTGAAAGAFHGSIDRWRATQRAVEDTLAEINAALAAAGAQYAQTEQANLGLFR